MKLPCLLQPRVLKEALTALFKGGYTSKFPFVPLKPAEKFRGRPVPDKEWCIGCGACAQVCPPSAIELVDDVKNAKRKLTWRYDRCIFCGQCEANCTTEKGVHLGHEFDLACFDRKDATDGLEFELVMCPGCGDIIGTKKHILWLVKKLGPLAFGNLPMVLTAQKELEGIKKPEKPLEIKPAPKRSSLFTLLCPKCRREVLLFDEYGKEVKD